MKLNLLTVRLADDAIRMLNGALVSDWLIAAGINFSSTAALRLADLEELPSNSTMGPVNSRPLQGVRINHSEQTRE